MPDIKKIKLGNVTYDIVDGTHKNIIILEDNGSTTAGAWLAKTDRISAYVDGQLFLYRVTVAGASATTLNITGASGTALGAAAIYRTASAGTKLSTQYPVGAYVLLYYCKPSSGDGYFVVVNDYPTDNDKQTSATSIAKGTKLYLLGSKTQTSSGTTTYTYSQAYIGTDGCLYSNGDKVSIVGHDHDVTTANAAPNAHTHNVVVQGTTAAESQTAVAAATAIGVKSSSSAAPGGHAHNYDKATGITLTANASTATGRIKYVESITDTPPSLGGTTTFITGVNGGSGSLKSYDAATGGDAKTTSGRIPYVHSISAGSASGTGTGSAAPSGHKHSYSYKTYSLSGDGGSNAVKYMKVSTTAAGTGTVGISGGSGSLTNDGTSANGIKFVEAQGTFTAGTTPPKAATFSGTKTNALVTSATTKYAHWSAGSLPALTITTKTPHKITAWSAGTTPVQSAALGYTSTNSGNGSGTTGDLASYSAGVLTINKTVNSGSHTHTYDKANSAVTLTRGTAPSLTYEEVSIGSASGWSTGSLPSWSINTTSTNGTAVLTAVTKGDYTPGGTISFTAGTAPSMGAATTKYLKHSHTAASLTGTKTFATSGISSVGLSASDVSTDGPGYVESVINAAYSLVASDASGTTAANSGTAVSTISGVSYTAPAATTYYLDHTHTAASSSGSGTVTLSNGTTTATTKYLSAVPTHTSTASSANSGTNFNAATAVQITSTANVAPTAHTHGYGSATALTTDANSGTAVAAVTDVKPSTN